MSRHEILEEIANIAEKLLAEAYPCQEQFNPETYEITAGTLFALKNILERLEGIKESTLDTTKLGQSELIVTTGPSVVCLCGSTRFYNEFQQANYRETMLGRIVLSVGFYPHGQQQAHGEEIGCSPEVKVALDELHLCKIDLADEVLILNVDGYIGQSTGRELRYALANGKRVRFWEPEKAPDMNEFTATAKI